jgi:hypothetical protein
MVVVVPRTILVVAGIENDLRDDGVENKHGGGGVEDDHGNRVEHS